jgi:GNAT superfamily N-acetyltransferase
MTTFQRLSRTDKTGAPFEVGECGPGSAAEIKLLYEGFGRYAISQGLPPAEKTLRERWVDRLAEFGCNFLVWQAARAVGHSAVIPDFDRMDGEYIIFVCEGFRNRGLGSALTQVSIDSARRMGLMRLWLTVESINFRAIRLYRNSGFSSVGRADTELTMILRLT